MKTGEDILFAIDEVCQKANEDTTQYIYDFLQALGNRHILSNFEQLIRSTQLQQRGKPVRSQNRNSTIAFVRHSQMVRLAKSSTLQGISSSQISPIFQVVSSFMQGDARGTVRHMEDFLQPRATRYYQPDGMELESVHLPDCNFNGLSLRCLLDPDVCSHVEKTIFLRLLSALSYRQTNNQSQTNWLLDLMSPVETAFCKAQMYNNYQQQVHCITLLNGLDQLNLSSHEYYRQQALLHDTLGILFQGKDPQESDILRLQWTTTWHGHADSSDSCDSSSVWLPGESTCETWCLHVSTESWLCHSMQLF